MDEDANKILKIILSIFPPVCLELGIVLIGKFESHFKDFKIADYATTYTNYSIFIMNLMQIIDFLLYLFLGYYLQNVLPHDFGIKRPLYFLCTCDYWNPKSKKKNTNVKRAINKEVDEIENEFKSEKENINIAYKNDEEKEENESKTKKKKKKKKKAKNEDTKIKSDTVDVLKPKNERRRKRRKSFEAEDLYVDKTKPDDILIVNDIV
jgi:hypothetical protein